jgi:L-ascorbate metabolism protein UlaG (beta-lactamase superfamily)
VHLGGTHVLKAPGAARGVEITIVFASHANNVPRSLLSEPQRSQLEADNASIILGPPTGYVIKFTNGLTAYLSGDTGIHSEMKTVVNDFHKARLALFNLGPNAVTGLSAAYAINDLVQPASVIATHPNEAVTAGGKPNPARALPGSSTSSRSGRSISRSAAERWSSTETECASPDANGGAAARFHSLPCRRQANG